MAAEQAEGAIEVDDTLSVEGRAADAKATGNKIDELKNDLNSVFDGTIDGYQFFEKSLSASSGVGQDWDVYYERTLPQGTTVTVIFFGYTGTDFTRFMIVGYDLNNTATNIKTFTTNAKDSYTFVTDKDYAKLKFNLRRSQNQQSVSMSYMIKANVGDALGKDIYRIDGRIDNQNKVFYGLPYVEHDGYYNLDGTIATASSTNKEKYTDKIEVDKNIISSVSYDLSYTTSRSMWIALMEYFADGTVVRTVLVNSVTTQTRSGSVTIGNNVKYIAFTYRSFGEASINLYENYENIETIIQFRTKNIKEQADEVDNKIKALPVDIQNISYTIDQGHYILRDDVVRDSSNFYMTSLILVKAGQSLYFKSQMPNNNQYGRITEWTSQDVYVDWIWSPETSDEVSYTFSPDSDTYVKLCGYSGLTFEAVIYKENEFGLDLITSIIIPSIQSYIESDKALYPLKGLKWDTMGDSLTNHDSVGVSGTNYVEWIANGNGIDAHNIGQGGKDWWNGFLAEVENLRNTADIVTIFGSFNEISSAINNVGNPSDSPSASGSFCARMKNILNAIYAVKNDIKIGVILPTPWVNLNPYDTDSTTQTGVNNVLNAMKAVCAMYSIPVLDLYHESMMRPWDEAFRNTYYRLEVVDGQSVGDGVHPNTLGHKLYVAPKIEAFLRTMVRGY